MPRMKPCPNCGSMRLAMWESAKEDIYAVKCENCGLRGPFSTILVPWPQKGAENQAIEKWNELLRREEYDKLLAEALDLDSSGGEMAKDYARLEKEANWLAHEFARGCREWKPCAYTCRTDCPVDGRCFSVKTEDWREAARKAVEEK